jgi:NAD(P)-dependent dehydrogenase (short-subunit alcohol dehydrogenase family)
MSQKRILVIGGTGAQGFAVVKALVEAKEPFIVRVLSRNPDSELVRKTFKNYPQVEFFKGSFMDFDSIERALQDCYGVFVNTDGEFLISSIQSCASFTNQLQVSLSTNQTSFGPVSAFLRLQTLSQRFAISYIAASTTIFV